MSNNIFKLKNITKHDLENLFHQFWNYHELNMDLTKLNMFKQVQ
uniref:Uncharacterized protein n=1 Tax=Arundo donax TaxID=35708 RepID=A0A0A8Y0X4_ARUDO